MKLLSGKVSSLSSVFIISSIVIFAAGIFLYPAFQALSPGSKAELSVSQPDTTVKTRTPVSDTAFINLIHKADQYQKAGNLDACLTELEKAAKIHPLDSALRNRITQVKGQIYDRDKKKIDYIQSISAGDAAFQKKDYLNAKAYYQLAMNAQPNDSLAKTRLDNTMNLLRSQKAQNTLYDVAVANADRLLAAKEYDKAKTEYENASGILPNEAYPKAKINEIIKLKVEEQVREEQYAQAIKNGDQYYNDKNWQPALLEYQSAVKLKPDEKYPRDRVAELTVLVEAQRKRDDAYIKSIGIADQLFESKSYPASRKEYENASQIKPEQSYPKTRMQEIDRLLAAIAKQQKDYDKYVNLADSFYIARNFIRARDYYVLASGAKPGEHYPREMLDKVNQFVAGQEAGEKASEEAYQSAIAIADKEFAAKNYDNARHEYQRALEIKPAETYPIAKIQVIDGLLADLVKNNKRDVNYQAAVTRGDSLLGIRDYDKARAAYTEASTLKPSETYPKEKLAAITALLAEHAKQKQAIEKEYADLMLSGEKLFKSKSLEPAKAAFSKALELKPGESLPKRRIASIDSLSDVLVKQKSLDDQYSGIIAAADKLLLDNSFEAARSEYLKASALKPSETYPKSKIREIDKSKADLAALKSKDSIYAANISEGDRLLGSKSYDQAKAEYQKALKLKPDEAYPKGRIGEIDLALAEIARMKSTDEKYQLCIIKADKLLASKSYPDARQEYTNAATLKPSETYPVQKIGEIDKILADVAKQKALDDEYKGIIADAEKLFAAKTLGQAKSAYQKALELNPAEELPRRRIVSIDSLSDVLAKQKSLEEQYSGLIADADKLLQDKAYGQAKIQYNKALTLKPSETYPKTKLSEIERILADLAVVKAKDSTYAASISEGDRLLASKSYDQAKTEYQKAHNLKPDEAYPRGKIGEIDLILAEIAKQKSTDEKYQQSISKADKLLASKSYPDARLEYTSAAALKPSETYPAQKIGEIDKIVADSIAKQKSLDEQYTALIAGADKLLQGKSYEQSRAGYRKASELKPSETYPMTKLTEIDKILAELAVAKAKDSAYAAIIAEGDRLLASKSFDQAKTEYQKALKIKPDEDYPKGRIGEIDLALAEIAKQKSIDEKYQLSISKADQLLASKSYSDARQEYTNAAAFKPSETYPAQKIGEIDRILAEIALEKALEEQYAGIIASAEKLFAAKTMDQAKSAYQKALELKPAEELPKRRIVSIDSISDVIAKQTALDQQYKGIIADADKLLQSKSYEQSRAGYRKASELKPAETYPKTKLSEIDRILADLAALRARDSAYAAAVASGDKLMASKTWDQAKTEYQRALQLKPDEAYPKTKITEADNAMAEAARQKAQDEKYQTAIQKADQLLLSGELAQARAGYVEAGKIKPGEAYPQDKIKETDGRIAEAARLKTLEDRYKTSIGKADQLLTAKSYDQAKTEYNNALSIKPGEQYPADKIKEIESILAEIRAREEAYKASVLKADQMLSDKKFDEARTEYENALTIKPNEQYPKNKIDEINKKLVELQGRKKTFDDLVIKGDNSFNDRDWGKSREYFQQASGLFPEEKYPKDRLERLTTVIDSIYRANKGKYDKAIAEADKFYNGFEFDKAIDGYTEAAGYLPMENYPKEMIARIRRTLAENAIADVLNSPVTITSNDEKQFKFTPVNIASRKDNFIYIKLRNLSGKPFNVLLRYGKDKQPSGGIVIRNLSTDGKINERLISVREQDVWYRIDNDFISLYPQGGDIEVSFIQVSKAR